MNRRNIHIENLQIRLPKGTSASEARRIVEGLGNEVLSQIAENTRQKQGNRQIGNLDAGKIKNSGGADLQRQIARRIAAIVGEKTK